MLSPLHLEPAKQLQLREQNCLLNIRGGWQALLQCRGHRDLFPYWRMPWGVYYPV